MFTHFIDFLNYTSLWMVGLLLLVCMIVATVIGYAFRLRHDRRDLASDDAKTEGQEGYVVSAVLGLLALLLGFTFSLATDRFEQRRQLVLEETNAIGTAYLRTQLLGEPHRARLSQLLINYTENKIALAKAATEDDIAPLLMQDNTLLTDIWAATAAAFDSIKNLDFSSTFVDAMNNMIDLDASRRAARTAHVPTEVFGVLWIYIVVAAGVLGYVLSAKRSRRAGLSLLFLLTLSLLLIIDIDRPTGGGINESQRPMEKLLESLKSEPSSVYDRWRGQPAQPNPN